MSKAKKKIRNLLKWTYLFQLRKAKRYYSCNKGHFDKLREDEKPEAQRFIQNKNDKTKQIISMLKRIKITIQPDSRFQHWIDTGIYVVPVDSMTDNIPPHFSLVLENSINELIMDCSNKSDEYYGKQLKLLHAVEDYVKRSIRVIDDQLEYAENDNLKKTRKHFERMISEKAESLEEALQRILFWDSIFWQSQHTLVGLGRLDKILAEYLNEDEEIEEILIDFLNTLHKYYAFKSGPVSVGDTGQIIIVGGREENGEYYCNRLTYDFIRAMKSVRLPDPKILLRVSDSMPTDLLALAMECIGTGIGCPLLANDDVIIPALIEFGYEKEDTYDYVTSACWEPVAYGKSLEKNNIKIINYAKPLEEVVKESILTIQNFDELIEEYLLHLSNHLTSTLSQLDDVIWEEDPLMSLFTKDCNEKGVDISCGGAKYSDYGILSVGLANAVNSLLNIKHRVFEEGKYSLESIRTAVIANYIGYEDIKTLLGKEGFFGIDNEEAIELTNRIIDITSIACENYRNPLGGKVKFGLSAPNYVEEGAVTGATPDGRDDKEPLKTHIISTANGSYTSLVDFASKLNYSGVRSNGNVVDFIVSPSFIESNFDKFVLFIKGAIRQGFFEMQMNVVSSATLIDAKKYPEKYPDLIVRVWGFSAYFKDLPEGYQNVLIERALQAENAA